MSPIDAPKAPPPRDPRAGVLLGRRTHDLAALEAIYAEVDRALAGWGCDRSADCCRFARTGREPHVWENEWALVERAVRARGVRCGPLPVRAADGDACPLLAPDGRCAVYA